MTLVALARTIRGRKMRWTMRWKDEMREGSRKDASYEWGRVIASPDISSLYAWYERSHYDWVYRICMTAADPEVSVFQTITGLHRIHSELLRTISLINKSWDSYSSIQGLLEFAKCFFPTYGKSSAFCTV